MTIGRTREITTGRNRRDRKDRREKIVVLVLLGGLCALSGSFLSAQQPQPQQPPPKPSFQSSVEVTSLDVTVVDDKGKPITTLAPADFAVKIDGNTRRVVTAEWVPLGGEAGVVPLPKVSPSAA
jgi:hypothetical protein